MLFFFDSFADAYLVDLQFNLLHFKNKTKRNETKRNPRNPPQIESEITSRWGRDLLEIVVKKKKKLISLTQLMLVNLPKTMRGVWI